MKPKEFNKMRKPIVKATVCTIIQKESKILLTKRAVPPEKDKWCPPSSHIDIGETALEAVTREIKEETGMTLTNTKFFKYQDEFLPEIRMHAIVLFFTANPEGTEKSSKEVSQVRWFTQEQIKSTNIAFKHNEILNDFFNQNET